MEKINDLKGWSVKQWEDAVNKMQNVKLEEIRIHHGIVVGATGVLESNDREIEIKWLWDGRAFILNHRSMPFDIKFE